MGLALRILSMLLAAAGLVLPALRWRRAAFVSFVALGLLSFPLRAGWPAVTLESQGCELLVGPALALHSFRNVPHLILFALCFPLARAQYRGPRADAWALLTTVAVGALVEVAQAVAGHGHCRLRDLLPDAAGALLGWAVWLAVRGACRQFRPHGDASA